MSAVQSAISGAGTGLFHLARCRLCHLRGVYSRRTRRCYAVAARFIRPCTRVRLASRAAVRAFANGAPAGLSGAGGRREPPQPRASRAAPTLVLRSLLAHVGSSRPSEHSDNLPAALLSTLALPGTQHRQVLNAVAVAVRVCLDPRCEERMDVSGFLPAIDPFVLRFAAIPACALGFSRIDSSFSK